MFVHINIWTPTELTKSEKELIEKLQDSANFIPNPDNKDKSFFTKMRDMFS